MQSKQTQMNYTTCLSTCVSMHILRRWLAPSQAGHLPSLQALWPQSHTSNFSLFHFALPTCLLYLNPAVILRRYNYLRLYTAYFDRGSSTARPRPGAPSGKHKGEGKSNQSRANLERTGADTPVRSSWTREVAFPMFCVKLIFLLI